MRAKDPIRSAITLPGGAVFYRCALQVNPAQYLERYRGRTTSTDSQTHGRELVEKALELGVAVLAVTDHNHVGGVAAIRDCAAKSGIHVFPGFELCSSEGVHVLCVYDPEATDEQLERYLGQFGIKDPNPSSSLADKGFTDILRCAREQGGLAIAAHATNNGGLFRVLTGQARMRAWKDENLLAIQIPGGVDDLPADVRQIVENKNSEYRRSRGAEEGLGVAVVNAKDVAEAADLEDPSATCWIRMSHVGIEGLRQAFLDPGSRIRLFKDPVPEEHAELVAMTWEGGFFDGAAIHFNPNLNVLVGGRGTGKSTVVESLRYVLDLEPLGEEAQRGHEGIVRSVLRSGTKISVLTRVYRPSVREYRIERTVPNPAVVRSEDGKVSNLTPEEVLPRVEIYGQHEISELTRSGEKLTRLLDRFVERDESLSRRKASVRRDLEKTRRSILDVRSELEQVAERLASLPGLEETLKSFQNAGLEDRLKEQSLLVREEQLLKTIPERLQAFRDWLEGLRHELPIDRAFLSKRALEELPAKEILGGANSVLDRLSRELAQLADQMEKALKRAEEEIGGVRKQWEERKQSVQAGYERILRELHKSRVDGEEFIHLRRQIEELRPLREREALLRRTEKEHSERRRTLLADWEDLKAQEFRLLDTAAKMVSRKLRERVEVEVVAMGNREPLFETLRQEIGGRLSEAVEALSKTPTLSLPSFVEKCRAGGQAVAKAYSMPPGQAEKLATAPEDVLLQIEELELPSTTTIKLNTAPSGASPVWQSLQALSTGQKATAVLLLLLLESDAPLIVDQPEDDLDNRFITEGVVPKMRDEKRRRQFVFSTHNANIPVLGDAELILGLHASGEAELGSGGIAVEHMGSIDSRPVRELVEEILEGGKEAFEMRRLKYGF